MNYTVPVPYRRTTITVREYDENGNVTKETETMEEYFANDKIGYPSPYTITWHQARGNVSHMGDNDNLGE